jgi:hypothetical protein
MKVILRRIRSCLVTLITATIRGVECVARGEMPGEMFVDGLVVNTVIDAAYQSIREHRWVPLS